RHRQAPVQRPTAGLHRVHRDVQPGRGVRDTLPTGQGQEGVEAAGGQDDRAGAGVGGHGDAGGELPGLADGDGEVEVVGGVDDVSGEFADVGAHRVPVVLVRV